MSEPQVVRLPGEHAGGQGVPFRLQPAAPSGVQRDVGLCHIPEVLAVLAKRRGLVIPAMSSAASGSVVVGAIIIAVMIKKILGG
jgi:hypothetical protein